MASDLFDFTSSAFREKLNNQLNTCMFPGTKLLAGVYDNSNGALYLSSNKGVTWTAAQNTANKFWVSVASSADGKFL